MIETCVCLRARLNNDARCDLSFELLEPPEKDGQKESSQATTDGSNVLICLPLQVTRTVGVICLAFESNRQRKAAR